MVTFHPAGERAVTGVDPAAFGELVRRSVWVDIFGPTREEELALEAALGFGVPTREEMQGIELSSRLYEEEGALFMTATILTRADTSHPESSAVTFIFTPERLVTLRYADPAAFRLLSSRRDVAPHEFPSAPRALCGLADAIVERLADILENTSAALDQLSVEIFSVEVEALPGATTRSSAAPVPRAARPDYKETLKRVGRCSDLVSRARESIVSITRLLSFFRSKYRDEPRMQAALAHLDTVSADLASLGDHDSFLSSKVAFMLDATLGLINNEQNNIIKIVSVVALVFLPPTLVASIYGMNFEVMPELKWLLGYPLALVLMVISAVLPYAFFKRKGWL
ncbi:MAG: magnesium transporter CorA family protein [Myxococcaceae bacterium]|nr:magnesium transporter CorA family protein [Myxococcaceae bacterium]MCI0670491.1 magnesium transporter CorA family protein [Myxococcaceae bacterium]